MVNSKEKGSLMTKKRLLIKINLNQVLHTYKNDPVQKKSKNIILNVQSSN